MRCLVNYFDILRAWALVYLLPMSICKLECNFAQALFTVELFNETLTTNIESGEKLRGSECIEEEVYIECTLNSILIFFDPSEFLYSMLNY